MLMDLSSLAALKKLLRDFIQRTIGEVLSRLCRAVIPINPQGPSTSLTPARCLG